MSVMMLVLCLKRQVDAIADEFGDWKDEGVEVRLYGVTDKAHDGFILLEWKKPIPERFYIKLKNDGDITDYFTYDVAFQSAPA